MKSFQALRDQRITTIIELSCWDMFKLLLGRELTTDDNKSIIRQPIAYAAFNMTATIYRED